jgi:2-iminobutanoate/2-iminopropanoate deaminase
MTAIKRIADDYSDSFSKAVVVPVGEYSLVFICGRVGHPPDGPVKVTAEPFEEEAKLCMENVKRALKQAGATLQDVVRITTYLTDVERDYPAWDKVRKATFAGALPASSTVGIKGLLVNARMEIDTVAVIKNGKKRG